MIDSYALNMLKKARAEKYGIGAFNVVNLETLKAVINAGVAQKSPLILEVSDGELNYFGLEEVVALKKIAQRNSGLPIVLNLDHGKDVETCVKAVDAGFDYIHFDGSSLPLNDNIAMAAEVVKYAHSKNIPVEGEIDHIEGSSADHTQENSFSLQDAKRYTEVGRAKEFIQKTKVDVFAAFFGNLHGIYKNPMKLHLSILEQLVEQNPETNFSLHGGSGIFEDDVKQAIQLGIVKINVNSDMRIAFKKKLKEEINATNEIAFYKFAPAAIEAVQEVVESKIKLFGSANKAL